jgi:hypothetical protein
LRRIGKSNVAAWNPLKLSEPLDEVILFNGNNFEKRDWHLIFLALVRSDLSDPRTTFAIKAFAILTF